MLTPEEEKQTAKPTDEKPNGAADEKPRGEAENDVVDFEVAGQCIFLIRRKFSSGRQSGMDDFLAPDRVEIVECSMRSALA